MAKTVDGTIYPMRVIFGMAALFAALSIHFAIMLNVNPEFLQKEPIIGPYYVEGLANRMSARAGEFTFHSFVGLTLIVLGYTQMSQKIRRKYRKLHKAAGAIYTGFGVVAVITGVYMSHTAFGKYSSVVANYFFGGLWLWFTGKSLWYLYKGDYRLHGIWNVKGFTLLMIPSFTRVYVIAQLAIWPDMSLDTNFATGAWAALASAILLGNWYERAAHLTHFARREPKAATNDKSLPKSA